MRDPEWAIIEQDHFLAENLVELIDQLKTALKEVPAKHRKDAEAIITVDGECIDWIVRYPDPKPPSTFQPSQASPPSAS
jgi:hypothetical protein